MSWPQNVKLRGVISQIAKQIGLIEECPLHLALSTLVTRGVDFKVCFDIGAYRGDFAASVKRRFPGTEWYLFEANAGLEKILYGSGFRYYIVALSSQNTERLFYSVDGSGDSIYRERTQNYQDIEPRLLKTHTLDCLIQRESLPLPDLIKIDTQGSELDILEGGELARSHAKLIYLECPIMTYNEGAPGFEKYIGQMRQWGFFPAGLPESHVLHGVLVQVDILFVSRKLLLELEPGAKSFFTAEF